MFEKYGEFGSYQELNEAAAGFKSAGEVDKIIELAEENGIDEEDARDYFEGMVDELCTASMAALGKLDLELEDYKTKSDNGGLLVLQSIVMVAKELCQSEGFARAVRQKDKRISNIYTLMADAAKESCQKNKVRNGAVAVGMSEKALKDIIRAYYLDTEKECKDKVKAVIGG